MEGVAKECSSQNVANTLWAYATMGRRPGERVLGALEARAMTTFSGEGFGTIQRFQLHQYLLSCVLDKGLQPPAGGTQQLRKAFESACRQAFAAPAPSSSESHLHVSQALRKDLGLCVQDEYRCPKSGYSIDILVSHPHARPSGKITDTCAPGSGGTWAVEVDGR